MFSGTAMLVKIPSKSQCVSIIENDYPSIKKRVSIVFASDKKSKKVGATSGREIERERRHFELFGYRS